ncbi:MAG TPA: cytochrome c-type biogenesis protein [Gemmatimonadaceae bacterium]
MTFLGLLLGGVILAGDANPLVMEHAVLMATVSQSAQQASDSALDARTSAVAEELRCPVCQGVSIQESPSELAGQMRAVVKDQLRAGRSPDQVKAYFVSKYGEWILLEPKPRGFNLIVYALPAAVILGGLGVIVFAVRRWTRPVASPE